MENVKEATCEEAGTKERECKNCHSKETETIKALGHNYNDWFKVDEETHQRTCSRNPKHIQTAKHEFKEEVT